jgi:hypothetical protein
VGPVDSAIPPGGILNQTIAGVTDILGDQLDGITVERAVIGPFYTQIKPRRSRFPAGSKPAATNAKAARSIGPGAGRDPSFRQLAIRQMGPGLRRDLSWDTLASRTSLDL